MSDNRCSTVFSLRIIVLTGVFALGATQATAAQEELATPMSQLQQLTHKLNLASHHKNTELARFYMEESLILLNEIQETIPEYQRIPVAVFIDRFAKPAYAPLQILLRRENKEFNPEDLKPAMQKVIDSCNACHEASKFEFIKINYTTNNPYNQDFNP